MWRSFLFVPTLQDRFVAKAASRGADAVILDLEASIAPNQKDEARAALPKTVDRLANDVDVTVRINPLWMPAILDLEACVMPGVKAVHMALCESAEHVKAVDAIISELEHMRGLPVGGLKLVAMIESATALTQAPQIAAASPRLVGMTLGVEDYATSMGVKATPDLLRPAVFQLNQTAKSAGLYSFAIPASMADFSDTASLEVQARYARAIGTGGGYAVHPTQIEVLNTVFSPTTDEIDWAKKVMDGAKKAEARGLGVFKVDGQMIDKPLVERAVSILRPR
ncbi:MAG: CoA ester lyase [Pseudomonadota bacterium]